jgi:GTPase SAR1 family protein
MKTLLSQFCEEFDAVIRPLLQPMTRAADTLNHVTDKGGVKSVLPQVLDVRHHLGTLADKVAEQQAYVLIFGPLKSGKSTLMNAISGAYVSEVTALPAYPTMVFVQNDDDRSFTVTRYNGETQEFRDMDAMRTLMEWAHGELADRLREVEERGQEFDPQEHIPQAIRRVDVKIPANHLAESSAVLVDTPGLYSRMKFGYDRLTREFRNTAASAIFVVKTDNLFLEQVFEEFEDLLELFSRVFLVVNIDSTKRDLFPDGELGPSLESQHPDRIVAAYQNLSMTNPLRKAVDDGRLKIYPVDLLQAASMRMRGDDLEQDVPVGVAGFHAFMRDLSEYLNSTEYLVAFLSDSLRQAWNLLSELKTVHESAPVQKLSDEIGELEEQKAGFDAREKAILTLAKTTWDGFYAKLGEDLSSIGGGRIEKLREQTADQIAGGLDHWFEADGSFSSLVDDDMRPLLQGTRDDLARTVGGVLGTVATTEFAGGHPTADVKDALKTLGLSLGNLGTRCMKTLDPVEGLAEARLRVSTAMVPVKRSLLDYLLLRRHHTMQKRLFGPSDAASRPVSRHNKSKKLGEAARAALQHAFEVDFSDYLNGALDHVSTHVLAHYVDALRKTLRVELKRLKDDLAGERAGVEQRLEELQQVSSALTNLAAQAETTTTTLAELSTRYGETDPEALVGAVTEGEELEMESDSESEVEDADTVDTDELEIGEGRDDLLVDDDEEVEIDAADDEVEVEEADEIELERPRVATNGAGTTPDLGRTQPAASAAGGDDPRSPKSAP